MKSEASRHVDLSAVDARKRYEKPSVSKSPLTLQAIAASQGTISGEI